MTPQSGLRSVTISGADDGVKPAELVALSREFPFVEWGILHSTKRRGTARYPSERWLCELVGLVGYRGIKLSAHLCGDLARRVLRAYDATALPDARTYSRVQLNGWSDSHVLDQGTGLLELACVLYNHGAEFILQVQSKRALDLADTLRLDAQRVSVLFDKSGGLGIPLVGQPVQVARFDMRAGYAGGLNPDNVLAAVEQLESCGVTDYWLDCESGARDESDRFDLTRVRRVLELTAPLIGGVR